MRESGSPTDVERRLRNLQAVARHQRSDAQDDLGRVVVLGEHVATAMAAEKALLVGRRAVCGQVGLAVGHSKIDLLHHGAGTVDRAVNLAAGVAVAVLETGDGKFMAPSTAPAPWCKRPILPSPTARQT